MSTEAIVLRTAICEVLASRPGYNSRYVNPVPVTQPDELPSLRVIIAGEDMQPDGDANIGELRFISDITIAVTVLLHGASSDGAEIDADAEMAEVEAQLLTDPAFTRMGAFFDAIPRIRRTRIIPREGETYFAGVRTDFTFQTRTSFPALVEDDLKTVSLRHRVAAGTPQGGFDVTFEADDQGDEPEESAEP